MRIGINVSVLKKGENISGIGYYTYRIIKDLIELDEKNEYFLFSNCELSVNFPLKKNVHFILLPFKSRLLWSRYILGIKTKKYKLDVFWSPTHNLPIVQQRNTKYFMTVHDIANHILPNISQSKDNQQRYLRVILNSSCKTADSIIVPSLATKNDLVDYFKVKEDKIKVVYEGGDAEKSIRPIDKKELVDKYKITKPYFLYIGTLQPRKNIETIVDAFERLNNSNVQLVLAGGIGWGMEDTLNKIKLSNCSNNIILTGYISEAEKAALYSNAMSFVFPSLYEGFGIPILESFSYGIPVITARNSSLPEVGGDAAIYMENVHSSEQLEEAMQTIINMDVQEREALSLRGIKQYNKFTWKKCAKGILKCFENYQTFCGG